MKPKQRLSGVVLVLVLLGLSTGATATPYLDIRTFSDWQQALGGGGGGGRIDFNTAQSFFDMVQGDTHWPSEYRLDREFFFNPTLEAIPDWQGQPCLFMTWGNTQSVPPGQRIAAAWDFVYDMDPALGSNLISFSIFPPVPSTMFSLNLIDKNWNYREWIWHADVPGNAKGEVPAGQWSTLLIDPVTGGSNWPTVDPLNIPFIHNVPGTTFDLNSIQILRFDENISATPGFPPGPGGSVPNGWVWNAWDHVTVNPEPTTMVLLGGGIAALLARRRKKH